MSANKWMKWLSIIALIFAVVPSLVAFVCGFLYLDNLITGSIENFSRSFAFLLLVIWAVIVSFKKDSSKVTAKKK